MGKSSLYRHEVRRAAIDALLEALGKIAEGAAPEPLNPRDPGLKGRARPVIRQEDRAIDWESDLTEAVVRRIHAAEGHPGVLDVIEGSDFHLFGAHEEWTLRGRPGEILAQRDGAICRSTRDGAVWITQLKRRGSSSFKLPARRALELAGIDLAAPESGTYREIACEERAGVGYLSFDFYNGAMSTDACERLRDAYLYARSRRETKVLVLSGGSHLFSTGIHLNVIEAAEDPAAESWRNLNAINDVVREIIETESRLVISALAGDTAAGGVPMALAADRVVAREDVVLNPYYAHMGGLYGSEYWTYLLPRRVGVEMTTKLTGPPFSPIDTQRAVEIGLLDAAFAADLASFRAQTRRLAEDLARDPALADKLEAKRRRRRCDERIKPLQRYRTEEMARSHECFFGPDRSYHEARTRFRHKLPPPEVPAPSQPRAIDAQAA